LCNGLLVYRIYHAHDDLRHALRKDILIELAGPQRNEPDPDAELPALGQDLF
jgi:hypothetical protein